MQRKAILALLLLAAVSSEAQQKNKPSYKKEVSASPKVESTTGHANNSNKDKKVIPEHAAPVPQAAFDYHKIGAPMPPLRVVDTIGKAVATAESVKNSANLFVMMFNPTCEHCEDMTRAIEKNIQLFKASNIVLMAAAGMGPYLVYFDKNTNYTQFPKLQVGIDSAKFIDRTFNYEMLPQINIYNKERRLIKSFSGLETIDSLKQYIQ